MKSALQEALSEAVEARLADLHTALPGEVVSYDKATQTATVQPMVDRVDLVDGAEVVTRRPAIPNVPVIHPRVGSYFVHLPVSPGDTVLLVMLGADASLWRTTGLRSPPSDDRKHDLSQAVAIPGLFPSAGALADLSDHLSMGHTDTRVEFTPTRIEVDGATDAPALASKVDTIFRAISAIAAAADPASTMAAVNAVLTAVRGVYTATPPSPSTVTAASTKIKVGG